jgi:hypothetical protein
MVIVGYGVFYQIVEVTVVVEVNAVVVVIYGVVE